MESSETLELFSKKAIGRFVRLAPVMIIESVDKKTNWFAAIRYNRRKKCEFFQPTSIAHSAEIAKRNAEEVETIRSINGLPEYHSVRRIVPVSVIEIIKTW